MDRDRPVPPGAPPRTLRVLVVDDSAVVREVVAQILSAEGDIVVATAADPIIAGHKIAKERPDVVVLDVEMPRMDGLTFLRAIMADSPLPVVICSALAASGSDVALAALEEGAVEVVAKPQLGLRDFLHESGERLVQAVRAAADSRVAGHSRPRRREAPAPARAKGQERALVASTTDRVIAIGASTGGTEALREILEALPPDAPGVVVVQHMPAVFTAAFARRLDQICRVEVAEAREGDRVLPGRALIAPGNRHLVVTRSGAQYFVHLDDGPPVSRHRPSVDVLFSSVARAVGSNAVGVILTGMGADGAQGLLEMKRAGASTIAQDEATCIVFGMPREAIERGAVDDVLPLPAIARRALERATSRPQ